MDEFQKQYSRLNGDQKKAVDTIEGPVLVIAGPGTGKTQVLSLRIANILKQTDVDPKSILCLTFQDASVLAMKNRLQRFIGQAAYKVQIHTFHSFCSEIIRTFPYLFDFDEIVEPIRDLDKLEIFKEILQTEKLINLQYRNDVLGNYKGLVTAISNLKKEYISPELFSLIIDSFENSLDDKSKKLEARRIIKLRELQRFYIRYLEVMNEKNLIDFDDMIYRVTDAFAKDDDLVKYFQEQYLYTLVDEFQDTNNAQLEVIKAVSSFAGLDANVFAVGDDDQTIFRFQGASSDNFEKYLNIFPQSEIIVLHSNYRSKQDIIDASTNVIANNPNRISESVFFTEKSLNKSFDSGYKFQDKSEEAAQIHEFEHSFHEDFWIGEKIKEISSSGAPLSDIAIISRTNKQITNITKFLDKHAIPYNIKRSESLLDDDNIKDLLLVIEAISTPDMLKNDQIVWRLLSLSYFKNNQFDIFSLYHDAKGVKLCIYDYVMDQDRDKIDNGIISTLPANLKKTKSINKDLEVVKRVNSAKPLNKFKYANIKDIFEKLIDLQKFIAINQFQLSFSKILQSLDLISYFETLPESYSVLNKITSLYQYIQSRTKFLKKYNVKDFLGEIKIMRDKNINLPIDQIDPDIEGKINILTAHSAKGLEFKYVFIYQTIENKWEKIRGANDGISLPPLSLEYNSDQSYIDNELEKIAAEIDERRLFYVAITRAKEYLFFTYSKKYYDSDSGEVDTSEKLPSKFLVESRVDNLSTHKELISRHQEISQIILTPELPIIVPEANQNHLKDIINKDLKLSASKINKYQKCHYKFLLEDIYKVPTPQNASLLLGTSVHTGIERFYKLQVTSEDLRDEIITELKEQLSRDVDLSEIEKEGSSKEVLINDLENSLLVYYDFYLKNPVKRVASEFWSTGTVEGIKINGRIDMVSSEEFGFIITDFKTSQNVPSITEFLGLTKAGDKSYLRQLLFYKLLLENSDQSQSRQYAGKLKSLKIEYIDSKEKVVKVFDFPAYGDFEYKPRSNSRQTETFDLDKEYENLKTELRNTFESIHSLDFERTEDRKECQHCPFKEHCRR